MFLLVPFFVYSLVFRLATAQGEACKDKNSVPGFCTDLENCKSAIDGIKQRIIPETCYFENNKPIVCCTENPAIAQRRPKPTQPARPVGTTANPAKTTTEYIPTTVDYEDLEGASRCAPLDKKLTSSKTGQKSWDVCLEYQEKFVYPCVKESFIGKYSRKNNCHHNADELIAGGVSAATNEFPHMTMLGYGARNGLQWLCGGSLISDRFILTAAHCISYPKIGPVTYVLVGVLRRAEAVDPSKVHKVKRIIKHPSYSSPVKYNDIALLELEEKITLDQYTVPACLHVGDPVADDKVSAAGWGLTNYSEPPSEILQKVTLTKFTTDECSYKYPQYRLMDHGVDPTTQVCYGDKFESRDTCAGDSGGPLHVKSKHMHCMYVIVGVTSFGKACGFVGDPGIYTRVAPYVSWIESTVWP